MKVINRIMIFSALSVFLSLFSLIAVLISLAFLFPESGDILDKDVFLAGEILEQFEVNSIDWDGLNTRLSEYGYQLLVLKEDQLIFSSLNVTPDKVISYLKTTRPEQSILTGEFKGMAFVGKAATTYSIFAIKGQPDLSNPFKDFWGPFLTLTLIVSVIIVLLSQFFTRRMTWRLLRPLSALAEGSKRIENGDLTQPVVYAGKDEFTSVCTAFNHMQEYLLQEREKNAAYERARTDLIAGISHDLRTPLTSVKGYIKGLRDGVANTPEKQAQYLRIAYEKAGDMDVLLQKLFFISSLETGKLPLFPTRENLTEFARRFAESIQDELACQNASIIVEATSAAHPVQIDEGQMRRVLLNLTENALKYAQATPLILRISIWREQGREHLLFADNGHGVPEEQLEHLFEQFWRGDEARSSQNEDGSGLGLYIVKYIVEAHGGTVSAGNANGLQIKISLPWAKEENR